MAFGQASSVPHRLVKVLPRLTEAFLQGADMRREFRTLFYFLRRLDDRATRQSDSNLKCLRLCFLPPILPNRNLLAIFEFWFGGDECWHRPSAGKNLHTPGIFPEGVHMSPSACLWFLGKGIEAGNTIRPAQTRSCSLSLAKIRMARMSDANSRRREIASAV